MSEVPTSTTPVAPVAPANTVSLTIDGTTVTVAKGTNVLEAARTLGSDISAFCYHPGLSIAACCRQCLVSIEKNPKLQPSCQTIATDGMVVKTKDPQSTLARKQMLEFTLVNHPIDCPICDKAGECTLQKLYFEHDNAASRVDVAKVHKPKVVDLGPHVVLDAERCILCTRCIRVCDEVAGVHQLEMANRGNHEELGTAPGAQLDNPYSLNTVDVCPVGALTAKDFRFTMRAWELEMTPSICNGCATGCNLEIHHKNERAWRLVPRHNPDVNQYWMCDEGRFTYHELREQRLAAPQINGFPATWERSISEAQAKLAPMLKDPQNLAVVLSAVACNEDNFAMAQLAKSIGAKVFISGRPLRPERADGRLRDADVNPNTAGVKAIADALGLGALPADALSGLDGLRAIIALGEEPLVSGERMKGMAASVVFATHERGPISAANIVFPVAAWAEISGTITNRQGKVQRMHPALPAPGHATPGWQAVVRLAQSLGFKLAWNSAEEVFTAMKAAVPSMAAATWGRRARKVQLRFAASRG